MSTFHYYSETPYPYTQHISSASSWGPSSSGKMSSSKNSEFDHTSEEWEAQRDIFTHYYAVEDKPLREVKEIMESQYGFRAT